MLNFVCNKENIMKKMFWLCSAFVSLLALMGCGDVLVDTRDNQVYRTVTIGNQTWMAQNLNYRFVTPEGDSASYCYHGIPDSCTKYGRFYTRDAAMDLMGLLPGNTPFKCNGSGACGVSGRVRGVCPEGWHLPSKAEWDTLIANVGGPEMAAKKLRSTSGWNDNGKEACGNGSDDYLFTVVPAGLGFINHWDDVYDGTVRSQYSTAQGMYAFFWSSTDNDEEYKTYFWGASACEKDDLTSPESIGGMQQSAFRFSLAFSVRCIKDY